MSFSGTTEQDDLCNILTEKGEKEMAEEFDPTVKKVDLNKVKDNPFRGDVWSDQEIKDALAVKQKTVEQFRQEIIADIFQEIKLETDNSISFVQKADYVRAKFCEYKTEGLHKALSIMLDASTIEVRKIKKRLDKRVKV